MALIKCPECGKEVSDKAATCIHCEHPLQTQQPNFPDIGASKERITSTYGGTSQAKISRRKKFVILALSILALTVIFALISMLAYIKFTRSTFSSVKDMQETVCGSYTSYRTAYEVLDDEGNIRSEFKEELVPYDKIIIEKDSMLWISFLYNAWGLEPYDKIESTLSVSDWNPRKGEFLAGRALKCKVMKDGTVIYSDRIYYPDSKEDEDGSSHLTKTYTDSDTAKSTATFGEQNALKSANSYLDYMAFSYKGLIEQLEYEGYSHSEAIYGADNCGADWNEQAAKCAANYLGYTSFSRSSLIEQLEYEGFTHDQAVYGAEQNGY